MPRTVVRLVAWGVALAGVAYRLEDFGRYGFWNDEAWVALTTRVDGLAQWWLSICVTPVAWAAALRAGALGPGPPEVGLRLLPLGFGVGTLWCAYRLGHAVSATRAGGVLALAVIAFDRQSIFYAKDLKHYTAEAMLSLLALLLLTRFARHREPRHLWRLGAVLALGTGFANAQLFLAPALLGTLFVACWWAGDRRAAVAVAIAVAVVGLVDLAYLRLALEPRLTPALSAYWLGRYVPTASLGEATSMVLRALRRMLAPSLGDVGFRLAPVLVGLAILAAPRMRVAAAAVATLLALLIGLSAAGRVPFADLRTNLFLSTAVLAIVASSPAAIARRLGGGRPIPTAVVSLLWAVLLAVPHQWRGLGTAHATEDLGPLVARMEEARRPDDAVLVYAKSAFVYAYYRRATPLLLPWPRTTVGYVPAVDDPRVRLVSAPRAAQVLASVDGAPRVWFLGSRFAAGDEARLLEATRRRGPTLLEARRSSAVLLLVGRHAPVGP